jgi:HSP20 family protein
MDRLFEESVVRPRRGWIVPSGNGSLAVDMHETDDDVIVKAEIPGLNSDDLDVTITGDTLTIKGETKAQEEIEKENYIYRERRYGRFSRSLAIPTAIKADEAEADYEDGVLTLTLPKAEEVKPKAIEVQVK